ncbi:MAG: hypothetical protein HZC28_07570 [Spirochaetes bacterium]|nr:hypothetical protein [Spirochaetota bacterium]
MFKLLITVITILISLSCSNSKYYEQIDEKISSNAEVKSICKLYNYFQRNKDKYKLLIPSVQSEVNIGDIGLLQKRSEIIETYGNPLFETKTNEFNCTTMFYKEMIIIFGEPGLIYSFISNPIYSIKSDIKIGMKVEDVFKYLNKHENTSITKKEGIIIITSKNRIFSYMLYCKDGIVKYITMYLINIG